MSPVDPVPRESGTKYPLNLSVVICTHNPYGDYLRQTVTALSAQTLPADQWELIIIDNLSDPPVEEACAQLGHPRGRIVVESRLGLTMARLRGIAEAKGDLILFIDDDNIVNSDYLSEAVRIGAERPYLGAWGAAKIIPRFEGEPRPELLPFTKNLSIRNQDEVLWSNLHYINDSSPMGAGLCVRSEVARRWAEKVDADPIRRNFGRRGSALGACEDSDLAMTSSDFGLGNGIFPSLQMIHLIPRRRYEESFLIKNAHGWGYSSTLFDSLRRPNRRLGENRFVRWLRLRARPFLTSPSAGRMGRQINIAQAKGIYDALNELDAMSKSETPSR